MWGALQKLAGITASEKSKTRLYFGALLLLCWHPSISVRPFLELVPVVSTPTLGSLTRPISLPAKGPNGSTSCRGLSPMSLPTFPSSALSRMDQNPLIANGQDSCRGPPSLLPFETCNFKSLTYQRTSPPKNTAHFPLRGLRSYIYTLATQIPISLGLKGPFGI